MEEAVNFSAALPAMVSSLPILRSNPLVAIDVGCSGGLHFAVTAFGDSVVAHGFDPAIREVARLTTEEKRSGVRYHAAFVGLPASDPRAEGWRKAEHTALAHFSETSSGWAIALRPPSGIDTWQAPPGSTADPNARIDLDGFLEREAIRCVDFLKIDTDGADLEVLQSCERAVTRGDVGVISIESPYVGTDDPFCNTFHNIDRFMRRAGMELINLEIWRYSMKELPAPFIYRATGQTTFGPPFWGNAIYANPRFAERIDAPETRGAATLKQAALMDVFGVPDCATRALMRARETLQGYCDLDALLDALTPPLNGRKMPYREYVASFKGDMQQFFPS